MEQQTAVEQFADNVLSYKNPTNINGTDYILIPINKVEYLKQQALQMERERMIKFANDYIDDDEELTADQYYTQTYTTRLQNETN